MEQTLHLMKNVKLTVLFCTPFPMFLIPVRQDYRIDKISTRIKSCNSTNETGSYLVLKLFNIYSVIPKTPCDMMRNYLILSLIALLFGCQSRSSEQSATDSTVNLSATTATASMASDTVCFRQIMGRDTTTLRLVVNGEQASGYLDIKPYEKDRARGSFQGTVKNNQIQADWQRSGEGKAQPYVLDLTLKGDSISWYEGERIEKQGKWVLKKPNTGFSYVLIKTDCLPAL